jgi:pilus assembly protein Flp/PilA
MKNLIARFVKDESGATAIEYGSSLNTKFTSINTSLK